MITDHYPWKHPRSAWQDPRKPIAQSGQSPANWNKIDTNVVHYTGADNLIDGDPGEYEDRLDEYMRAMQSSYLKSRGYSLGYNGAVDWLGGTWQIRGYDIQTAANKNHNGHTFTVLMLTDGDDGPTPKAAAAVRSLFYFAENLAGLEVIPIRGHCELSGAATACPGRGHLVAVHSGLYSPRWSPVPTDTETGDEMKYVIFDVDTDPAMFGGDGYPLLDGHGNPTGGYFVPEVVHLSEKAFNHHLPYSVLRVIAKADLGGCILNGPLPEGYTADDFAQQSA